MRLKELFIIPEGKKVTEKVFGRVLISSVCSILLCMVCLISTTWAWFTISIDNMGNEIQIGKPEIKFTVDNSEYVPGTELENKDIILSMVHANTADEFHKKSTLYVTLTIQNGSETTTVCTTLNESNNYSAVINIQNNTEMPCSFGWTASWFAPVKAVCLTDSTIVLDTQEPAESSAENTTETTAALFDSL